MAANQILDTLPHRGVALDLDVASHEDAVVPRILRAGDGLAAVIDAEIAQDPRAVGVSRLNFLLAVKKTFVLVKICGVLDILRNEGIVLARLGNAIDLNGEKHGNAVCQEAASKRNHGAGTPAMSVKYDTCGVLFLSRRIAVMIRPEQMQNEVVGIGKAPVLERLDVSDRGIVFL